MYAPDAVGYPICTKVLYDGPGPDGAAGPRDYSCLRYHCVEKGITTTAEFDAEALKKRMQRRNGPVYLTKTPHEAWVNIARFIRPEG